jgi:NAD-dependent DNA ligase
MLATSLLERYPEYVGLIPGHCFFCEEPLFLNDKMTALTCENPACSGFLGNRISTMTAVLGVKGFGESVCDNIVEKHGLKKIHEIFDLNPDTLTDLYLSENNNKLFAKLAAGLQGATLSKAITSMGLVGIRSMADKIFSGYSEINEFYADFEKDNRFLIKKLGKETNAYEYTDYNFKKQIPHIRHVLEEGREDICKFVSYFTLKQIPKESISLVITGGIPGYSNKDTFVAELNSWSRVFVAFKGQVTKDINYVICNGSKTSGKALKATNYGIPVVTSLEFQDILKGMQ